MKHKTKIPPLQTEETVRISDATFLSVQFFFY